MIGEALQRGEDGFIVWVLGLQLDAVPLLNHQGDFKDIGRLQTETFAKQRRLQVQLRRIDVFEIQCLDNQSGQFTR